MSGEQLSLKVSNLLDVCLSKPEMTENKLAVKLATNRSTLWRWRKGKTLPRASSIKKICEIGAVDYNTFVSYTQPPSVGDCLDINTLITNYKIYLKESPLMLTYCLQLCAAYAAEKFRSSGLLTKITCHDFPPTSGVSNSTVSIKFKDNDLFDLYVNIYGDLEKIYIKCLRQVNAEEEIFYCEPFDRRSTEQLINLIQQTP